jgi:predicted flap endonuclease-1-like 5' DNA nuclease
MLNLFTFIWFCLLLAFALGLLLGYALWYGKPKTSAAQEDLVKDFNTLKQTIQERDKQLASLQSELATAKTDRDLVRAEAIPLNTRIDELSRELETLAKQKAALETGPKTLGELAAVAEERTQLQDERDLLRKALAQANTNIQTANATIQTAQTQLQAQSAEIERLRAEGRAEVLPAVAASLTGGLVIPPVEQGRIDDLKEIVGVGPFIEAKLRALGLQTFKQIALLTPPMLEKVAESIEYFQGRIGRENWTEQCKALHFDKYGEKL